MNKDDIFNPNVYTKVIGSGRVSTPGQEDNWSEKSQREMFAKYQKEFNWGDEPFVYETGSGTSLEQRPGLKELLSRIRENDGDGICGIFVVEQDRLTRKENMIDYATIYSTLLDFNIKVIVQRTIIDLADDAGNTLFEIQSFMAQQHRRTLLRNMKRGKKQKALAGRNASGPAPDGYTLPVDPTTKKSGKYAVDKKRAYIILLIFELADDDKTVREIKKELEMRGIPSPRGGKQGWSTSHIFDVLHNIQYLGIYVFGTTRFVKERGCKPRRVKLAESDVLKVGTEEVTNHTPLVTRELFYRVQEKLKLRQKRQKSGFELLTGIGVCNRSGKLLRVAYTGSGRKCYVCQDKMNGTGCDCVWRAVVDLNPLVWTKTRTLLERPLLIREMHRAGNINERMVEEQESLKTSYENELAKAKERMRRLLDLHLDERFSKKEFLDERQNGISESIDSLTENIRRVSESQDASKHSERPNGAVSKINSCYSVSGCEGHRRTKKPIISEVCLSSAVSQ